MDIDFNRDNTVCSVASKMIRGKRVGCIPEADFVRLQERYHTKTRGCRDKDALCKLETLIAEKDTMGGRKGRVDPMVNSLYRLFYKPVQPREWSQCKNKKRCSKNWITNHNIYDIMNQYMFAFSNFLFLGVFFIDYMLHDQKNLSGNLCPINRLNFSEMNRSGINICGMIFNTAKHNQKGEHWVSLVFFWHGNRGEINYYDSYGSSRLSPIPDEILIYMKLIQKCGERCGIDFKMQKSKIIHQRKNGECGIYSLFFIIHSLNNSMDAISERIPDDTISELRDIYWRSVHDNM